MSYYSALTIKFPDVARELRSKIEVAPPFDPAKVSPDASREQFLEVDGIWDTGATGSVVTEDVANRLGIQPVDETTNHYVGGSRKADVYLVNILLQNEVLFPGVRVISTQAITGADMLIGMDIISSGDFAVTTFRRKTCMTFGIPSQRRLDFRAHLGKRKRTRRRK